MAGESRDNEGDFKRGLVRLATRRTIERVGRESKSGSELRRKVREEISARDVPGLVTKLIEEEFVIDETRALVADDLAIELRERFGFEGLGVVLMGSAVHGGVAIRQLMGAEKNGDFDWGIVLDGVGLHRVNLKKERWGMTDYAESRLAGLSEKYGITPVLESCIKFNPDYKWAANLVGSVDVSRELHRRDEFDYDDPMYIYFFPSFPAEINERNRQLLLDGFSRMARLDRKKWQRLTSSFIEGWQRMHKIEEKHLTDVDVESLPVEDIRRRDIKLIRKASGNSQFQMIERMRELILATGNIEK